ncbi:MAG: hypothetical protein GF393_01160, partial [Armatimonadia bacterium]|nr:hypothetical protein [Armatimonadia bacterium]
LADVAGKDWVGWEPAREQEMQFRIEWEAPRTLETVACHWRHLPADYTVEVETADGPQCVATVLGNTVRDHKIRLHRFPAVAATVLRITATRPVDAEAGVSLRGLEAYALADPPAPVAAFLARETPQLLESPGTFAAWRAEHADDPLDEDLLAREIPTWEPITSTQYSGTEQGREHNILSGKRASLRSSLAFRHAQTGHPEYAERAWDVFEAIFEHYDRWQALRFRGREWQAVTFQEPGYMLNSFPQQYERVAEALTDEQKLRALYFIMDVADYQYRALLEFTPVHEDVDERTDIYNWVPNSMGALAMTAVMLDDFPQADVWIDAIDARFPGLFRDVFFLEDGTWWECSPAHHVYVTRGMFPYALAKHLRGEPIWNEQYYDLSYADTLEALAKTATPFGEYPSVNDSTGHDAPIRSSYSRIVYAATMMGRGDILRALKSPPRWPDIPAVEQREITLEDPDYTSVNMAASGMAVMRDGWGAEDAYLLLDYGPHGAYHGHYDKLSFLIVDDGHHWIPDAGCAPHYSVFPEQREWHVQTVAHNTVLIDGKSQDRGVGRLLAWSHDQQVDFACAEHDLNAGGSVTHRRAILHPRGEYFLVYDRVAATDGAEHLAEFLLHVYGEPVGQEPGRLLFRHQGKDLALHSPQIGEEPITMEQGLCGGLKVNEWDGPGYPGKGDPGWLYIPYFRLPQTLTAEAPRADYIAVIQAFEGQDLPEISVEQLGAEGNLGPGVRVSTAGGEDVFRWTADEAGVRYERRAGGELTLERSFDIAQ